MSYVKLSEGGSLVVYPLGPKRLLSRFCGVVNMHGW